MAGLRVGQAVKCSTYMYMTVLPFGVGTSMCDFGVNDKENELLQIQFTLRNMFGYPLSTLSSNSNPNVLVISVIPFNQ